MPRGNPVNPQCNNACPVEGELVRAAVSVCSLPHAPRACPGRGLILRKSGKPDLRWGRAGEGGRGYGAKLHPPIATPNPSSAGCGLARFRQYESDQPRQAGVGWGGEHTVRVATFRAGSSAMTSQLCVHVENVSSIGPLFAITPDMMARAEARHPAVRGRWTATYGTDLDLSLIHI